jgi:hypothetical protein
MRIAERSGNSQKSLRHYTRRAMLPRRENGAQRCKRALFRAKKTIAFVRLAAASVCG